MLKIVINTMLPTGAMVRQKGIPKLGFYLISESIRKYEEVDLKITSIFFFLCGSVCLSGQNWLTGLVNYR